MSKSVSILLSFILIVTILGYFMGTMNLDLSSYERMNFTTQSNVLGSQINDTVQRSTNFIDSISNQVLTVTNIIGQLLTGANTIVNFFLEDLHLLDIWDWINEQTGDIFNGIGDWFTNFINQFKGQNQGAVGGGGGGSW